MAGGPTDQARVCFAAPPLASATLSRFVVGQSNRDGRPVTGAGAPGFLGSWGIESGLGPLVVRAAWRTIRRSACVGGVGLLSCGGLLTVMGSPPLRVKRLRSGPQGAEWDLKAADRGHHLCYVDCHLLYGESATDMILNDLYSACAAESVSRGMENAKHKIL